MKLMKSFIASALVIAGTSAFAAPKLQTLVVSNGHEANLGRRLWSNTCVGNLNVKTAVAAKYKVGEEGEWQDFTVEPNTAIILEQAFRSDSAPLKLSVKFNSPQTEAGAELSYDLNATETRWAPRVCDGLETYQFEGTDDDSGVIDLVHVDGTSSGG